MIATTSRRALRRRLGFSTALGTGALMIAQPAFGQAVTPPAMPQGGVVTFPDQTTPTTAIPTVADPTAFLKTVTAISKDAQGEASHALASAGDDPALLSYAVADHTGSSLGTSVSANVATVDPSSFAPGSLVHHLPLPVGDAASIGQDTTLTLTSASLLANDVDPDGGSLALVGVTGALHGHVALDPHTGAAGFSYTVANAAGGTAAAQVAVAVTPMAVPPEPAPDTPTPVTVTPSTGQAWGDVHYETFDGFHYDLQATGDYLLTRATAGPGLIIEGRAEGTGGVSFLTAVTVEADGHRFAFDAARPHVVEVDGRPIAFADNDSFDFGPLRIETVGGDDHRITTSAHDVIDVVTRDAYLDLLASPGTSRAAGSFAGLLGNLDGKADNDLVLRDGTPVDAHRADQIEGLYADSWRVGGPESLLNSLGQAGLADRAAYFAASADHALAASAVAAAQAWHVA